MTDEGKGKVTFRDENGEEKDFEHLATIEYDSKEYIFLIPIEEIDEDVQGVITLEIEKDSDGNEVYCTIDDEEKQEQIFKIFKKKYSDQFSFS